MDRPKEAIEKMRDWACKDSFWVGPSPPNDGKEILAYLDWLEGKHVVVWPKELTRERLEKLAEEWNADTQRHRSKALRALAAIAPVRKKRVVNLWESKHSKPIAFPVGEAPEVGTWRCVARNIELEE